MNKKYLAIIGVLTAIALILGAIVSFLPDEKENENKHSESIPIEEDVNAVVPSISEIVTISLEGEEMPESSSETSENGEPHGEAPLPEVNESSYEQESKEPENKETPVAEKVETKTEKNELPEQVSPEEGEKNPSKVVESTTKKDEIRESEGDDAPKYFDPSHSGENPFEGSNASEITNVSSDELIDEGADRPGEGIHF